MKLLTQCQHQTWFANGRRQAAVKGAPEELDFWPVTPRLQIVLRAIDASEGR